MNNNITAAMKKEENGTIVLTVTIPFEDVKKAWSEVMGDVAKNAEMPGFRKGKAPKKLVEKNVDREKIREEVLKKLLPIAYTQAIKTHNLKPIINPKIHIEKLQDPENPGESKGWQFIALTCELPEIKLGKYKEAIQKLTAKSKIILPGNPPAGGPETPKFEEIVKALLDNVTGVIPSILVDSETDRLLSITLEDVKKLGLTLDQYLSSTGKTPEILRAEYRKKAESDIRLEFALQKVAEEANIQPR